MKRLLFILTGLLVIYVVASIALEVYNPILSKWVSGSARIIGKPINAIVYTDGHINNDIKVYRENSYWDGKKSNAYIFQTSLVYVLIGGTTAVIMWKCP